jgi:hypothetical protein
MDEVIDGWAGPGCTQAHPYNAVRIRTRFVAAKLSKGVACWAKRRSITPDMHPNHSSIVSQPSYLPPHHSVISMNRNAVHSVFKGGTLLPTIPATLDLKPILLRSGEHDSSLKIEGVTGEPPPGEVLSYRRCQGNRDLSAPAFHVSKTIVWILTLPPSGHRTARPSSTQLSSGELGSALQ